MPDLPLKPGTLLFRAVTVDEIREDGTIYSTAFVPRAEPDRGLLSTEHESRTGGAAAYRRECGLTDIAAIYAVSVAECQGEELPCIDDHGQGDNSEWHVSIDFRPHANEAFNLSKGGRRKAKNLAKFAFDRTPRA